MKVGTCYDHGPQMGKCLEELFGSECAEIVACYREQGVPEKCFIDCEEKKLAKQLLEWKRNDWEFAKNVQKFNSVRYFALNNNIDKYESFLNSKMYFDKWFGIRFLEINMTFTNCCNYIYA